MPATAPEGRPDGGRCAPVGYNMDSPGVFMGLIRLAFILAVIAAAAWLLRDVLKRIGGWLDPSDDAADAPPRPKLVALERTPYTVLGLEEDASPFEIERAWRKIMAENAPEKVAGLSPEVQELAKRLRADATAAYEALTQEAEEV